MQLIEKIRKKAAGEPKVLVFPEGKEARVIAAAKRIEKEKIARVILLKQDSLEKEKISRFAQSFYDLRKHKGIDLSKAKKLMQLPLYYAGMMVRFGEADGFIAGASFTTPDVARAAIYCLGVDENIGIASSCFIMAHPESPYGEKGTFIFADCGIVPRPSSEQLARIALSTAQLAQEVLEITPRIAMLSYSTKGSAKGEQVERVKEAVGLVNRYAPELLVDGELQVDSAIVPEVAKIKDPQGKLKGSANILIFPNLEAGNIGYKLVQRLAGARAIGPLILGLNKPCSDLSRGCNIEDIIDCAAVTCIRAKR